VSWAKGFNVGVFVAVLGSVGIFWCVVGDNNAEPNQRHPSRRALSSNVWTVVPAQRRANADASSAEVDAEEATRKQLADDVDFLQSQHAAAERRVEAARAKSRKHAGAITPEDLSSEENAQLRLRDGFLAIPMMTAGLPKEQTVQMILRQRHVLRELVFLGMSARFITGSTTGDSYHYLPDIMFEAVTACRDAPQAVL
jgi:hypothetical protein